MVMFFVIIMKRRKTTRFFFQKKQVLKVFQCHLFYKFIHSYSVYPSSYYSLYPSFQPGSEIKLSAF